MRKVDQLAWMALVKPSVYQQQYRSYKMNVIQRQNEGTMVCKECLSHSKFDNTGVCKRCTDTAMEELLQQEPSIMDPEFGLKTNPEEEIDWDLYKKEAEQEIEECDRLYGLPIEGEFYREARINAYPVEGTTRKGFYDEEGNYHRGELID